MLGCAIWRVGIQCGALSDQHGPGLHGPGQQGISLALPEREHMVVGGRLRMPCCWVRSSAFGVCCGATVVLLSTDSQRLITIRAFRGRALMQDHCINAL